MIQMNTGYELINYENDSYRFVTDYGNEYKVVFSKTWHEEILDWHLETKIPICELYFEESFIKRKGSDPKIASTLIRLIDEYLKQGKILYYVTERKDGKEEFLFKVYNFWYNRIKQMYQNVSKFNREIYWDSYLQARFGCLINNDFVSSNHIDSILDAILSDIYPNSVIIIPR